MRMPLSEWTNEHFRLSSESSVQPGHVQCFPFQLEPLDCLSPRSKYETTVLMMASQMSKSTLMLASIAYAIAEDPGPMLVVQPNLGMAEAFSKDRLSPMFRDTPKLHGLIADPKARDSGSTIAHRRFIGGHVSIVGANSPAGLASRPIRYLYLDEVDRFEASAGAEGDPVDLAKARTRTFWNRKIVLASSPTIKGSSRIEAAYLESDQREFHVPCPFCSSPQVLRWERVEWPDDDILAAAYRCEYCEKLIPHARKAWMVSRGRYRAGKPGSTIAGFRLSELNSPWRSWGELAVDSVKAMGNPERRRAFLNTSLCELWDDEGQNSVGVPALMARRELIGSQVPAGVVALSVGVDVQGDRLELELVGWGRGEESWSLDYRVLPGDTLGPDPWIELDQYLATGRTHPLLGEIFPAACCVDSGYIAQTIFAYARDRFGRRVFAIKGKAGNYAVWPKRPTRLQGGNMYIVGVDSCKATLMGRLQIAAPGPGYCHFPSDRPEEFFNQLLSEVLTTTYRKGRPHREWVRKKGCRAEALDCRSYAYAGLHALVSMGLRLDAEADRVAALVPKPLAPTSVIVMPTPYASKKSRFVG